MVNRSKSASIQFYTETNKKERFIKNLKRHNDTATDILNKAIDGYNSKIDQKFKNNPQLITD